MANFTIEARSYAIPGLPASHNFWVLRNSDTGAVVAELHGLATDRLTKSPVPIGTDPELFSLTVWHYIHDDEYASQMGSVVTKDSLIKSGQTSEVVFSGTSQEVLSRWNSAVDAMPLLNRLDLDYPSYGFKIFGETINSNFAYGTLGEIMGVPVYDFPGVVEPGLDNRMVTPETINTLKYKPTSGPQSSIDWDETFQAADSRDGTFTNLFSLTTTATTPTQTPTPDGTSGGPSSNNNLLLSTGDYTAGIGNFWDVNTASGNQAAAGYAVTDGLRPGNNNMGLNINASTGQGLHVPVLGGNNNPGVNPVDYGLYGSSFNNAANSNFQLMPTDPLVLDLSGDGVQLTNYSDSPVLFDSDNDGGSLEQTGWVSACKPVTFPQTPCW